MLVIQRARWWRRILCSLLLFFVVALILGCAVDELWFREDDLGLIINGFIDSWSNFFRVLFSDCRSFITPCNYQRTIPNFVSGFLRPLQHFVLSIVYALWGVEPLPYYYANVIFHAANAALFLLVCSLWLPLTLACCAGFVFAFYPDMTWLVWITTLQNSLATFFVLLTVLVCHAIAWSSHSAARTIWSLCAGFLFLCSLLSRETALFMPVWFLVGAYIFLTDPGNDWLKRVKEALCSASVFFVSSGIYILMRLSAFGVQTLPRTVHNLALRYPSLAAHISGSSAACIPPLTAAVPHESYRSFLCNWCYDRCCAWLSVITNSALPTEWHKWCALIIVGLLCIFILRAFHGHLVILGWLMLGMLCTMWPGILAYPNQRYLNLMYPFVVFIVIYSVYAAHKYLDSFRMRLFSLILLAGTLGMGICGMYGNVYGLANAGRGCLAYKQRFADFFAQHQFAPAARFVIVSTPFTSDIQSIFQAFLHNRTTRVVCDPFATLAQQGIMGCRNNFRTHDVASTILPIPGGVRLISGDEQHCGWWLWFSDFPLAWSATQKAYEWTTESYRAGIWYPCSIGKFMINKQIDDKCASDISFVFDAEWVDEQTIVVAWDTMRGCYYVCPFSIKPGALPVS
jgi:hypothetical protein